MEVTISHVAYGLFTLVIIGTMIFRKGVVLPTLLGTFVVAFTYKGSFIDAFIAIFQANVVAAQELFHIFLIIALMLALLQSLKEVGADRTMIQPFQKLMINGHVSFFVLVGVTYVISLFFWPTPAVPLICSLLVPAAVRSGLPVTIAAVAVALSGQGMALSSDYIIQVAPSLSAKAAGVDVDVVASQSLVLSLISGTLAMIIVYVLYRQKIRSVHDSRNDYELQMMQTSKQFIGKGEHHPLLRRLFAIVVPITFFIVIIYMVYTKLLLGRMGGLEGGDGAAFIGGVAVILLMVTTVSFDGHQALHSISHYLTEGFVFAFQAMGPVIPIAGFFFLGSADFSSDILNTDEAPAFLFDLIQVTQQYLPQTPLFAAFSILIIGMITGLDGSGFSGLPLVGGLAASLETSAMDASTLASIGQMGAIWTGGGTLVAWSSLIAIAGFCNISVMDLVRKNVIPVISGLTIATVAALFIF